MPSVTVRSVLASLVLAVVVCAGCRKTPVDPFPASGDVAGWQKTDATRTFAASDLWQYIDGDADHFVQAGVVSTSTSGYTYKGQLEAVVDVHTFHNADSARTLLETGLTRDAQHVKLGDEGIAYAQSVSFRKGKTLVRVVAYESTPETPQALQALARAVESRL